jgi:hypothetical protein
MDRISDSDSEDAGSIPAGATATEVTQIKTAYFVWIKRFFVFKPIQNFHQKSIHW